MPLHLYRRHFRNGRCWGGHAPDSQTYEPDELRPKWKKCACPIYASGTLDGHPKFRRNTQRVHWTEARSVADAWERHGPDAPPPDPSPTSPPIPTGKSRRKIADAIMLTLAETKANESALGTFRRYKGVLKKLQQFSTDVKGYVYLDQWTIDDANEFRRWWKGSARYHQKNFSFLRTFFTSHRVIENPIEKSKRGRNRKQREASQIKQKSPFTDDELRRMLAACKRYPHCGDARQKFAGEDIADFILISAYTGLRISDVATFHISRMTDEGDIHFRAIKNGAWVNTWVEKWLQEMIHKRAQKWGPYIFGARESEDPVVLGTTWRTRLNTLWSLCESFEEKPTHHRFRHTFVRILLESGASVPDVAALLGDTEEVVRQSYSKWVRERQDRLRGVLREALGKKTPLFVVR